MTGSNTTQELGQKTFDKFIGSKFPNFIYKTPTTNELEIIGLLTLGDDNEEDMVIYMLHTFLRSYDKKEFAILPGDSLCVKVDRYEEYYH